MSKKIKDSIIDTYYKKVFEPYIKEHGIENLRERLYFGITPVGYHSLNYRIQKALSGETVEPNILRDAIWAEYLQIPKNKRRINYATEIVDSNYKPTINNENIEKFRALDLDNYEKQNIINNAPLKYNENKVSHVLGVYFNAHTIGRGFDDKGEYISYYDEWDVAPIGKDHNQKDQSKGIGKPIYFYDRIYLDDFYNIPEKDRGNPYITPATIIAENKSNYDKKEYGGMMKQKRIAPNVICGGVAIPLKSNYFLMKGRTHREGGIDVGKDLEVEDGEVMKITKNNIKVLSAKPILNGTSPAEYATKGNIRKRFEQAFRAQEKFKRINGLNDDGTKAVFGKLKKKISNIYWHTLRAPKDYSNEKASLRDGSITEECAKWSNDQLQKIGLNVFGDAWTRSSNKNIKKIYSGYDKSKRPKEYEENAVLNYTLNAADSLAKTLDLSKLKENDIVGLYFRNSPNMKKAYLKGTNGETQTHTGHITIDKKGIPYVSHNVHGEIIKNKVSDLLGSNKPYGIVSVYRSTKKLGGIMKQDEQIIPYTGYRKKAELGEIMKVDKNGQLIDNIEPAVVTARKPLNEIVQSELVRRILLDKIKLFDDEKIPTYKINTKLDTKDNVRKKAELGIIKIKKDIKKPATLLTKSELDKLRSRNISSSKLPEVKKSSKIITASTKATTNTNTGLAKPKRDIGKRIDEIDSSKLLDTKSDIKETNKKDKVSYLQANPTFLPNLISTGINVIGSGISYGINKKFLNELKAPKAPYLLQPTKLKTRISIKPQVNELKRTINRYNKYFDQNTASSQTAVGRRLLNEQTYIDNYNQLYGAKENQETQLINQDRLQQHETAKYNLTNYNNWLREKTNFENSVREKKSENAQMITQNIAGSFTNFLDKQAQWKESMANIAALSAAYPDVTPEYMAEQGLPYALWLKEKRERRNNS